MVSFVKNQPWLTKEMTRKLKFLLVLLNIMLLDLRQE